MAAWLTNCLALAVAGSLRGGLAGWLAARLADCLACWLAACLTGYPLEKQERLFKTCLDPPKHLPRRSVLTLDHQKDSFPKTAGLNHKSDSIYIFMFTLRFIFILLFVSPLPSYLGRNMDTHRTFKLLGFQCRSRMQKKECRNNLKEKSGELESWKAGRLEGWRAGELE